MKVKKIQIGLIIFLWILLIFQSPLSRINTFKIGSIIQGLDEMITIVLLIAIVVKLIKGTKLAKIEISILILNIIFMIIGIISTMVFNIQSFKSILEDFISCNKFIITFIGMRIISLNYEYILKKMVKYSKMIIIILFILTVVQFLLPGVLFEKGEVRYYLYSIKLFYQQPAALAYIGVLLLAITSFMSENERKSYRIMSGIIVIMTLRSRAIGFIFIYTMLSLLNVNAFKKLKYPIIGIGIIGIIFLGYDNLEKYYLDSEITSARELLTDNSFKIAKETWPLGAGLGTYGSSAAAKEYSPIYTQLGYETRYGLSPTKSSYLTDTFWPIIIAEFGFLGLGTFCIIIYKFIKIILWYFKSNIQVFLSVFSLIGYLLVSSLGSSSFFNPISVLYAMTMAIIISVFPIKKVIGGK